MTLEGITATSYGSDDASHTLTLFNGTDAVDHLRFTQDITAAAFTPAGSAGPGSNIAVSQIAGGVFVSHLSASTPDGAIMLPAQS